MAALHSRCGHYIFVLWFLLLSSIFLSIFFSSPNLSHHRLDVYHASTHGLVRIYDAGLKCAACGLLKIRDAKNRQNIRHLCTIAQLWWTSQITHISTIRKKLLNSNTSATCPYNMVNFSPLAAAIGSGVWGTPANFNGFCVLVVLLHGTLVVGISQTLRH